VAASDDDRVDDGDAEARVAALKKRLAELAGGELLMGGADALPLEQLEQFLRRVLAFEIGPFTTDFDRLVEAGVELPEPESLDDAALATKLWEVIGHLGERGVFLSHTDHLSDRDLYGHLWRHALREEIPAGVDEGAWHVDLIGTGSAEDIYLHLKFYADEAERTDWLETFPDFVMPPHEDPPYDRDRLLPQPYADPEPAH
jgi:hypothetical protein